MAIGLVPSDGIVKLREYRAANPDAGPPKFEDPGFRALVEENVKNTVWSISQDPIMTDVSCPSEFLPLIWFSLCSLYCQHWKAYLAEQKESSRKRAYESDVPLKPVYVHG